MLPRISRAILGLFLIAGLASPALAQLSLPCDSFQRDEDGFWVATEPVTIDLPDGSLDVTPWHPVGINVASLLDAFCQ